MKAKHAKPRTGFGVIVNKSRMMRDSQVRFYQGLGVKFPGSNNKKK